MLLVSGSLKAKIREADFFSSSATGNTFDRNIDSSFLA